MSETGRELCLPYLEATAGAAPTMTKRKVIGGSEILIRTLPKLSQAMEKALGSCVSMVDQEDLHLVAFFTPEGCCFYTNVFDDADLRHFFHGIAADERRDGPVRLVHAAAITAVMIGAWTFLMLGLAAAEDGPRAPGLAQQNGVTAVILALVFERSLDGFVAVVAPAIVTINVIHALADRAVDAWGGAVSLWRTSAAS